VKKRIRRQRDNEEQQRQEGGMREIINIQEGKGRLSFFLDELKGEHQNEHQKHIQLKEEEEEES
jgi:hypothetical protein